MKLLKKMYNNLEIIARNEQNSVLHRIIDLKHLRLNDNTSF